SDRSGVRRATRQRGGYGTPHCPSCGAFGMEAHSIRGWSREEGTRGEATDRNVFGWGTWGPRAQEDAGYRAFVEEAPIQSRGSHRRRDYLSPYPSTFDASRSFGRGSSQRRQAKPNSNGQVSRPEVVVVEFFGERDHSPPRGQGAMLVGASSRPPRPSTNSID